MRKAGFSYAEVAEASGVSITTVDRVFHSRPSVKPATRAAVLAAAERLKSGTAFDGRIKLDIVLVCTTRSAFISGLEREISEAALERGDVEVRFHHVEVTNYSTLSASQLLDLPIHGQGAAIIAADHPLLRENLRLLTSKGVKIVTLASDVLGIPKAGYVGIDNRSSGRLAGYLIHKSLASTGTREVGLVRGSLSYRGQEEREMGFRQFTAEHPNLTIAAVAEANGDPNSSYTTTRALLETFPNLSAVYHMSSGNRGVGRAIEDAQRSDILFVGHDLTPYTSSLLLKGTMDFVIDQNAHAQAHQTIEQLVRAIHGLAWNASVIDIRIFCRENLPELHINNALENSHEAVG